MPDTRPSLPAVIRLMAVAGGLAAANLHYSQPLLPSIAGSLGVDIDRVGFLPATTQIGFALGILTVLPLADMLERRRLVVVMLLLAAAAMALHAYAPSPGLAFLAAFLVGVFGVSPQLMTPFAALLAPKGREGAAVGLVLSGILGGVLVSKILAGLVTVGLGWRGLYWIASGAMVLLAVVLLLFLPESRPPVRPRYAELVRSTLRLVADEPALRRHALYGGLTFASFMTFWSTYAIEIHERFGYGPGIAGLFGIAGLAGSCAASLAGRQVDRGRFAVVGSVAAVLMAAGFALLLVFVGSVPGLVAGVLLMDFGAGLSHAANQSAAFALRPEARGRINSIYMCGYFLGGAAGTSLATIAYATGGWTPTCLFGIACSGTILLLETVRPVHHRSPKREDRLASEADAA